MKFIIVLFFFSFPVFAQQSLNENLFPQEIVTDACGINEKTPDEFIKKFGKPKAEKKELVSNPHNETKNIRTTYTWSSVEAIFLTLPDPDPRLIKTFLVSTQTTKTLNPKQKVKIGDTRKEIEKAFGKLNLKLYPNDSKRIVYGVNLEMGTDFLVYTLQNNKVRKIECEKYVE